MNIKSFKRALGLTALELSTVLQIGSPKRVEQLCKIGEIWQKKELGRLSRYLHKPLGQEGISLFTLLKHGSLDESQINRHLDEIERLILDDRQEKQAYEAQLRKHGFKPLDKQDIADSLNAIDFMML